MSAGDETRKAECSYRLLSGDGRVLAAGEGLAIVDDAGVSAGPARAEFLDVDSLADADRTLVLGLWPDGELRISRLARRHETFATALGEARDRARTAGMLAHGLGEPEVFTGAAGGPNGSGAARLFVYATHVAVVPASGDPFQVPLGAVTAVSFDEDGTVRLATAAGTFSFGRLGRRGDAFRRAVVEARDAQGRRLAEITGVPAGFADGRGVPARELPDFDRLLEAFMAPEREACAPAILARATGRAEARVGLVELLDPDEERMEARRALPPHVAAFLLVPVAGDRAVLEVLSGPSAATYVFRAAPDTLERDLQAIHFRRRPLALTEAETKGQAGRAYRLALRRLEPLKRLRAATTARLIHGEGWAAALEKALS